MSFAIPRAFRKLIVRKLTPAFKDAIEIVQQNVVPPRSQEVLIKNKFLGINSSDISAAAGCYFTEKLTLPFEIGFEGIGEIVAVGDKVSELKYGQPVMHMKYGAFSEYVYVPEEDVIPIASANGSLLPLLVSGATASLSLDKCGLILPGDKVLITAAAGGSGHIAVQWAKNAGCHVIGTCSSEDKVKFLKSLGCDRPINSKEESLADILHNEYPDGVNVIWESTGGYMFDVLYKHLAIKGRMVIIEGISQEDLKKDLIKDLPTKLLQRSTMLSGFFLPHYKSDIPHYLSLLVRLLHEQSLKLLIDDGSSHGKPFKGLEDVSRAVEYLQSGKSKGKVIVHL
ncbi:prostaglandin reductase-3-like [Argiope bruennichi]|uniref:prostaglandin reductase-3-like n=1 Tax=Argiope bruennichi TaxID=94029 RepID=UPI002494A077|nr:prostaglandin reductase-3-like [Argiope bruennichi]